MKTKIEIKSIYGELLIITSNLSNDQLIEKYGERTIDRLRSLCVGVVFNGESLR